MTFVQNLTNVKLNGLHYVNLPICCDFISVKMDNFDKNVLIFLLFLLKT